MIAIISDIHGNFEALKAVLEKIDEMKISEIYCLGDVVGYYSQVNECCDELRKRKVKCVMGNHDWYFAADSFCPRSRSVNDCLAYQRKVITKENREWVCSFPVIIKNEIFSMVHGSWTNPIDEYFEPSEEYISKLDGKLFFSGHTHVQRLDIFGDKKYCNPGSVGQPRDYNPKAAFATLDGDAIFLHRVEYDIEKVGQLMNDAGFNDYYWGCLLTGNKNLCKPSKDL